MLANLFSPVSELLHYLFIYFNFILFFLSSLTDLDEDPVIEVLILTFQRLFEVIEPKDLNLMWRCLHVEINDSVKHKSFTRLSRLLSLLISTVQINGGRWVFGKKKVLQILFLLIVILSVLICFVSHIGNLYLPLFDRLPNNAWYHGIGFTNIYCIFFHCNGWGSFTRRFW